MASDKTEDRDALRKATAELLALIKAGEDDEDKAEKATLKAAKGGTEEIVRKASKTKFTRE